MVCLDPQASKPGAGADSAITSEKWLRGSTPEHDEEKN